jgi:ATP-binding cassette subfamily F protein 3
VSLASLQSIEKTLGSRILFKGLDFNVERGERLGFVGANGSGKTTLFRILTGSVQADVGTVAVSKNAKVGYLTQDPVFDPANTVMDEAELAFAQLHELSHKMRELEHEMAIHHDEALEKILEKYQNVQHDFETGGGYAWRHKLEATLLGVGLTEKTWEQPVPTLSGGQRSRLALAKLLISEPDLLLLDEPTNHLDLAAIEWLEKYLAAFSGAVVVVSHDRYLLDRLATRIIWLTESRLRSYPGNYSAFVEQRALQELTQQRAHEKQHADIEKQKEFVRRFGAGQRSKEAKGREKRLNRLLVSDQMIAAVATTRKIHLSLDTDRRAGDQVLQVRELSKSFGPIALWHDLRFDVRRGERIGIIGPNGSGKTTLFSTLLGQTDADAGEIKWGANLAIGYYDQRLDEFDPDNTVMEEVAADRPGVKDKQLRDALALMLFRGDDIDKPVGLLSGGERARLRLAELLLDRPNVLLLDEPTNHLDIPSCEALEGALRDYPGTVFCVSHDRYFLDKFAQRLFVLEPPELRDFAGNYTEWNRRQTQPAAPAPVVSANSAAKGKADSRPKQKSEPSRKSQPPQKSTKDNPYLRPFGKLSVADLERQITETEISLAECQEQLGSAGAAKNPGRGQTLQREYKILSGKLEALEAEYFTREK